MSKEAMRYRLEHNTPAREVQPGRDINILRGTVMVTEADHGRVIDALLAERDALKKDAERLDRLDLEREAYGFEGIHEGNRWMIDGPYNTVRDAIDAALQGEQP